MFIINYGLKAVNKRPAARPPSDANEKATRIRRNFPSTVPYPSPFTRQSAVAGSGTGMDGWQAQNDFSTWNFYWLRENDVFLFHFHFGVFRFSLENCEIVSKRVTLQNARRMPLPTPSWMRRGTVCNAYFPFFPFEFGSKLECWMRIRTRTRRRKRRAEKKKWALCRNHWMRHNKLSRLIYVYCAHAVNLLSHFFIPFFVV